MSLVYNIWMVVLTAYNLPPWLCMNKEFLMLTLLIPEPSLPEKDIDVFLQLAVEEAKELWETGFQVRDGANHEVLSCYTEHGCQFLCVLYCFLLDYFVSITLHLMC